MKQTNKKKGFLARIKEVSDVITAVGVVGAALVAIGTWCTTQINANTNARLDAISSQMTELRLDTTRSQLLTLMKSYPDNEEEIMKVAKYYFRELNGDWYMTSLFTKWAGERGINVDTIVNVNGE